MAPISCIIPTRNGSLVIENSLIAIARWLVDKPGSEILVLENGSNDNTLEILANLQTEWNFEVQLSVYSVMNFGEAVRLGARKAKNSRLVITADDLPFDLDDWESFDFSYSEVTIAHKKREINGFYSLFRLFITKCFLTCRIILLGIPFEVNGTIQLIGSSTEMVEKTSEISVSLTMELMFILAKNSFTISEVPVIYREKTHKSRVRPVRDSWLTLMLLFKLRKRQSLNYKRL